MDVPIGTVIKDSETGKILFELVKNGEQRILCKGGAGGLGFRFLRHIERNSVLLFCISCEDNVGETYRTLLKELREYNPDLLDKRLIVAITKCDLPNPTEFSTKDIRRALPPGLPIVLISSVTGSGLNTLKDELWKVLNERKQ